VDLDVTSLHHRRAVHRWERMSVGDLIERVTWSRPDKPAIVGRPGAYADGQFKALTYRQADQIANQVAHALLARGLERGDVILLFCENSVEAYLAKIGIAKAGLVAAPVNPMMAPDLVAAMIDLVQPKLAIVDAELWPKAEPPFTAKNLRAAVTVAIGGPPAPDSVSFTEFIAGQPAGEPDVEIHADDIWEILFTSGTTALPKGVMISHACSYAAGFGFALSLTRGLRLESDLTVGTYLPLIYHVGDQPFTFSVFLCGGTLVLGRRPHPEHIAEMIAAEKVTAPQQNYVGVPSPILASTVLDPDGRDLKAQPGVAGEAVYRSPAVMAGYYRDEAATEHAFRYGWFHSGDSCAYDDAGLRIMLDRYKDIVKTGGENVSSLRVEAVLAQHPDVAKAAVIGLPHPRWSEAVTAVVVLREGAQASEEDLIKHCRAGLAGYETPKSVVFAADLPETVGGKVLKYKLRAEHAAHYRDADP